jgi:hypothetical protein
VSQPGGVFRFNKWCFDGEGAYTARWQSRTYTVPQDFIRLHLMNPTRGQARRELDRILHHNPGRLRPFSYSTPVLIEGE